MKRIICFLSLFSMTFVACNNDDAPTPNATIPVSEMNANVILVKRITTTSTDTPDLNGTINFTYDGLKLVKLETIGVGKSIIYYTGNLITKIEGFDGTVLDQIELFTYNSVGKLIEYRDQSIIDNFEHKYMYVHNTDGSVSYSDSTGPIGNTTPIFSGVNIYTNNELSSRTFSTKTDSYVYDNKNNPFKNVTGLPTLLTLREFADDYLVLFGKNKNIIKVTDNSDQTKGVFCSYVYNTDNFPTTAIKRINFAQMQPSTINLEYFY